MKVSFDRIVVMFGRSALSDTLIDTLLTDSRSLTRPGSSLFFAIATPGGNDGHRFIRNLYDRGVRHFVVTHIPEGMERFLPTIPGMEPGNAAHFLIVDDVVKALQRIARRNNPAAEVVAITGSRGKTTVKEWIFQLLEPLKEIARSPRSFNSQTGVPLSMWDVEPSTELALIEAGISRRGEMANLAECIHPDTLIFTNIGPAHSDGFPSDAEKGEEKALLAAGEEVRTIIYNADDANVRHALQPYLEGRSAIGWSTTNQEADLFLDCRERDRSGRVAVRFTRNDRAAGEVIAGEFMAPVGTDYDLENVAACLAFMLHEGLTAEEIAGRFATLHRIRTRLNVCEGLNLCSVIHDSYTSDFSSLRPAINFMMRRAMPHQSATLILSDILHETAGGAEIYHAIAQVVRETGIRRFIGVGPNLRAHRDLFPENSEFFDTTDQLLAELSSADFESEIILLKGAPQFEFSRISELLEARKHETVLEVNLDAMVANYNYFRSFLNPGTGIVAMVKAFGYGAGSYEIAKTLQDCGAAYLAVAVLDEGIDLRRNGIRMPILVMNPKSANYRTMFSYHLEPNIYSLDMLRDVIHAARKYGMKDYPVHLKLDTGMHRTGLLPDELEEAARLINAQEEVRLKSVFSHLATSDCLDYDLYTERQLTLFDEMTGSLLSRIPYRVMRHVLNTAGIIRYPEHQYDMVRLGIGLYGANTLPEGVEKPLRTVSSLRSVIISIREWEAGEAVGYARKGVLGRPTKVATVPIGYADGMNRHFGCGNISVKVNGCDAPTVGNICMDQCMIDVTGIDCKVGDTVEIFGNEAPIYRLSDLLGTIPYEILTSVSPRVKRVYYRE
jgi:alanine racemase